MSDFIKRMTDKARLNPKRVAFPESESVPILQCAARVVEEKIGTPVLVGNPETTQALAKENGVSTEGFEYFDNTSEEAKAAFAAEYVANVGSKEKIVLKKLPNNIKAALLLLKAGKVDCVIIDNEPAKAYVKVNEGLKILDTEYAIEDYAIAISKKNEDLLKKVNEALDKLIKDGTVKKIVDKYINAN